MSIRDQERQAREATRRIDQVVRAADTRAQEAARKAREATRRADQVVRRIERGDVEPRPLPGLREDSMESMESMESADYKDKGGQDY